jgi:hypothetical protein
MDVHQAKPHDNVLQHSLSTIQAAKTELHLLTGGNPTPTALVSQIRLCEVLLGEIRAIRFSLEWRMRCRGEMRPRPVIPKRARSGHPAVPVSYHQILVTAGPVRRRRLWANGRSAWR